MCLTIVLNGPLHLRAAEQLLDIERREAHARFLPGQCGQQVGKCWAVQAERHRRREAVATANAGHIEVVLAGTRWRPVVQQLAHGATTSPTDIMGRQLDGCADACVEMGKPTESGLSPLAASATMRARGRHLADVQRVAKVQTIVLSLSLDALTGCCESVHSWIV